MKQLLLFIILFGSLYSCTAEQRSNNVVTGECIKSIDNPMELERLLVEYDIPCVEMFVKVAIYESAWFTSSLHTTYFNSFGWCYTDHDRVCGNVYGNSQFRSYEDQMEFFAHWISRNPKRNDETCENYLRRRCFNVVNPQYFQTLNNIKYKD